MLAPAGLSTIVGKAPQAAPGRSPKAQAVAIALIRAESRDSFRDTVFK